jgi:hypothetical protein
MINIYESTQSMKKTKLYILSLALLANAYAATVALPSPEQQYQKTLANWQTHKFDDNQIRSFVYYWFGLHDKHLDINQSYALLSESNLEMKFPEITVHNKTDYKKWYDGVGSNIKSNQHIVKKLDITMLANHQYRLNVVVNWQGIDKDNKFINLDATQQWLLVDGLSESHPYIQQYNVIGFMPVK